MCSPAVGTALSTTLTAGLLSFPGQAGVGDTADDVALEQGVDDQQREAAQHGGCHDLA